MNRVEMQQLAARDISARGISESAISLALPFIAPLITVAVVLVIAFFALDVPAQSFRSPDENASFIFTKALAENGSLAYESELFAHDDENYLHARGVMTHDNEGVPFNFLGLPVLYAPAYKLLGDNLRYVAVPLALLTVISLGLAGGLLVPERKWIAWFALLGATPIVFSLFRPFLNVLPSLAFMSLASYFLVRYFQAAGGDRKFLAIASFALAMSAFMRYELVILQSLLVLIVVFHKRGSVSRTSIRDLSTFGFMTIIFFVVPVGVLNWLTYGSPTEYGYSIFNDLYFPERNGVGTGWMRSLEQLRSVLFPSYPVDLGLATSSFFRQVLSVAPLYMLTAGFGAYLVLGSGRPGKRVVFAYAALAMYVFLYRGAGYSWLADSATPSLEASIVRYTMPLYVGCFFLVVYSIAQIRRFDFALLVVGMLVVSGLLGVLRDTEGNLLHLRTQLHLYDEYTEREILPNTEENALIFTDTYDKLIGTRREVATWWPGAVGVLDEHFEADRIARSMARVVDTRPVYILTSEPRLVRNKLEPDLTSLGLSIHSTSVRNLMKIEPEYASVPQAR